MREVSFHVKLIDPFSDKSSPDLGPDPPVLSLSSPFPILPSSLDPLESRFIESETSVLGTACLDQALDDNALDRLEDHFEVQHLTLGHPVSFNCHISFDWPYLGPLPSPFIDVVFHFNDSDHSRWFMHSYGYIIVRSLTSASDFTCTHLFSIWAKSFDKRRRALSCIAFI